MNVPPTWLVLWFRPETEVNGRRGKWIRIATSQSQFEIDKHRNEYRRAGDFLTLAQGETPWKRCNQ